MELTEMSTGDFAKICRVTKKTLYHYDRIGLLKPARVGENGYRYYDMLQCDKMAAIRMLRELGASLEEIQSFFSDGSLTERVQFMKDQQKILDEKMRLLEQRRCELKFLTGRMEQYMKEGAGRMFVESAGVQRYGRIELERRRHFFVNSIGFGLQYGVVIDEQTLNPRAVFYRDDEGDFVREEGEYLCMFQVLENGHMLEGLPEISAAFKSAGGSGDIYHEDFTSAVSAPDGKYVIKLSQRRLG